MTGLARAHRDRLKTTWRTLLPSDDEKVIYQLGGRGLRECWCGERAWQIRIVALDPGVDCQSDLFQRKHPARRRVHRAMDRVNARYGAMTPAPARLLQRSRAPDVISSARKPDGPRNSL